MYKTNSFDPNKHFYIAEHLQRYEREKNDFIIRSREISAKFYNMLPNIPDPEELRIGSHIKNYKLPMDLLEKFMCDPRYHNTDAFKLVLSHRNDIHASYEEMVRTRSEMIIKYIHLDFMMDYLSDNVAILKTLPDKIILEWLKKKDFELIDHYTCLCSMIRMNTDIARLLDLYYQSNVPVCVKCADILIYILNEEFGNIKHHASPSVQHNVWNTIKEFLELRDGIVTSYGYKAIRMSMKLSNDLSSFTTPISCMIDGFCIDLLSEIKEMEMRYK